MKQLLRLCGIILLILTVTPAHAGTAPLWQVDFGGEVGFVRLLDKERLVVGTDSALVSVNPGTGERIWEIAGLGGITDTYFGRLAGTSYALALTGHVQTIRTIDRRGKKAVIDIGRNTLHLIDYVAGKVIWNSNSLDLYSVLHYYLVPDPNTLVLVACDSLRNKRILAVDIRTGSLLWDNPDAFADNPPSLFSFDTKYDSSLAGHQAPVLTRIVR